MLANDLLDHNGRLHFPHPHSICCSWPPCSGRRYKTNTVLLKRAKSDTGALMRRVVLLVPSLATQWVLGGRFSLPLPR